MKKKKTKDKKLFISNNHWDKPSKWKPEIKKKKKRRRRRAVVVVKIFSRAEEKQQMGGGRVSGNWYELVVMVGVWNKRKKKHNIF